MCYLKKNYTNELIYKAEIDLRLREWTYGYQGGRVGQRDRLKVWDWHAHTTIFYIFLEYRCPGHTSGLLRISEGEAGHVYFLKMLKSLQSAIHDKKKNFPESLCL